MENHINRILLHINLIPGIGPAVVETLVKNVGIENIGQLYTFGAQEFMQLGVKQGAAHALAQGLADQKILDKEFEYINRYGIKMVTCFDASYPSLLKHIHLPPVILYYQGIFIEEPESTPRLAVVGSRKAGHYCQKVARLLLPSLIDYGFCIVSGGALGADTIAHQITLESQGKTVAVIGAGLLNPYPAQNRALFDEIIESGGALVSPFPLTASAQPGNFPARNRIISGLSSACLVLQAAEKSGALITASCALEQGREVCAVPGPIDDPLSAGCHKILSQGAHIATCVEDILNALNFQESYGGAHAQTLKRSKENTGEENAQTTIGATITLKTATKKEVANPNGKQSRKPEPVPTTPEEKIVHLCQQPISFDDLLAQLSIEAGALRGLLFDLQLDGKIEQNFMGLWQKYRD